MTPRDEAYAVSLLAAIFAIWQSWGLSFTTIHNVDDWTPAAYRLDAWACLA
jgi:hypothetical protein